MEFKLDKLLFERGMNMSDLYRKTGVRYNTINAYYHGYAKRMNVKDIEIICDTLNCTLSELMEYDPNNKK